MINQLNSMQNAGIVNEYLLKAKRGDVLAQKQLGLLLLRSEATANEGVDWLHKAAAKDADAMYLLGRIYLKRFADAQKAFYWYERAAQKNHIDAMVDVGAFYLFGYHVTRDLEKAVAWYSKAAELNSPIAYHNLGFLCLQDTKLHETAVLYLQKAIQLGYADSAYTLGVLYLHGCGVAKNPDATLKYLTLSHQLGKHYACRPIGDLYFQGAFDNGMQNPEKAIAWYLCGMEHDVLSCIEVLGDCYYHGFGVDIDFSLAYDFYKIAAEKGSKNAAFSIGSMYIGGEAVNKNLREALKWMLVAERRGHSKASQFVQMLTDVLGGSGTAVAVSASGGTVGVNLRSSYSAGVEAAEVEQRAQFEQNKKRNTSIYAAAGAMSGNGSYTDYDMGAVISTDGEVSYVDTQMGVILGANGSVSSHDVKTGLTYNWSTSEMLAYNEMFGATMNLNSGKLSYHHDGYTMQYD